MKYQILAITPTGCVIPVLDMDGEPQGTEYIETGDLQRAKKLLSLEDFDKIDSLWTSQLIASRKNQIEEQIKLNKMLINSSGDMN